MAENAVGTAWVVVLEMDGPGEPAERRIALAARDTSEKALGWALALASDPEVRRCWGVAYVLACEPWGTVALAAEVTLPDGDFVPCWAPVAGTFLDPFGWVGLWRIALGCWDGQFGPRPGPGCSAAAEQGAEGIDLSTGKVGTQGECEGA